MRSQFALNTRHITYRIIVHQVVVALKVVHVGDLAAILVLALILLASARGGGGGAGAGGCGCVGFGMLLV